MSTIVTRAGKGSELTWNEMDANFTNLNTDKYQKDDSPQFTVIGINPASGNRGINLGLSQTDPPTFNKSTTIDSYSAANGAFIDYAKIGSTTQTAESYQDVVKVGRLVSCSLFVQFDSPPSGTGQVAVPLPYQSSTFFFSESYIPLTIIGGEFDPTTAEVVGELSAGASFMPVWYRHNQYADFVELTNANLRTDTTVQIHGNFTYKAED